VTIDAAFDRTIRRIWAEYFGADVTETERPGTSIIARDRLAGTGAVHIWNIGMRAFAEVDPELAGPLARLIAELGPDALLPARLLGDVWEPTGAALIFHLRPDDLIRRTPEPPLTLRRLTPEEADEGYVAADHEVAFACLDGDRAVSVVSGYRRNGFMDMGSLTHPAYRGRRLAPAALAAACDVTFEIGMIPQYRCDALNIASRRVAEVAGFTACFTNEAISVIG